MHSSNSSQSHTHSVLAAGERLAQARVRTDWELAPIQHALKAARDKYGHALCDCRVEPLKLQIRLREGKLHLAVWPEEGPRHDTECLFFRDDLIASTQAVAGAPRPHSAGPHGGEAPLPFSGGKRIPLLLGNRATSAADATVVNVRGLLARLWEAAALCRWHPSWARDWGRARFELLRSASAFSLNGHPAESAIFAPRPYRESQQQQLNAEWEEFLERLAHRREGEARILIAPVRRFPAATSSEDAQVLLRHLHTPIALSATCNDFLQRDCRNSLSNSRLVESDALRRPELVGLFSVEKGRGRCPVLARAGWLMPVHPVTFIPAPNADAVMLVDALVDGRYAFHHLISESPASRRTAPDWLVRHVRGPDGQPVPRAALELMDRGASSDFRQARSFMARRMADEGVPTWTWVPNGRRGHRKVPPLPPHDFLASVATADVLARIQESPCADYALGPSIKFNHEGKPHEPGYEV